MHRKLVEEIVYSTISLEEKIEVIDADWKDLFGIAVLLRKDNVSFIQINGKEVAPPYISHNFSRIRWVDGESLLMTVDEKGVDEENIFIITLDGLLIYSFNGGEAIEEVAVGNEGIWISYFDEGIFGEGISTEGLVLFDVTGKAVFRYHSDLQHDAGISDCYGMCKGAGSTVWIFPYTDFPLIQVNPETRTTRHFTVPELLHGAHAISVRGNEAYFFDPYDSKQKIYHLDISTQKPQLLGTLQGNVRGLYVSEKHLFISNSKDEVILYAVIKKDEE